MKPPKFCKRLYFFLSFVINMIIFMVLRFVFRIKCKAFSLISFLGPQRVKGWIIGFPPRQEANIIFCHQSIPSMWLRQPALQRIALLNQVQRETNLHFGVGIKISTRLYFSLTSYLIKYMGSFLHIVYFSVLSL